MEFKVIILVALMGINGMITQASELPDGPHIVTFSTASVDAVPDITTLAIEVNVAAKGVATTEKQMGKHVVQYISFLELNQIMREDISSANLRTQPGYDYQDGKGILRGYRVMRMVGVIPRQLDKLNSLLDDALKVGLNEVHPASLDVAQPDTYRDKVRRVAIDDVIRQAQGLANGFHRRLRPVYSVHYHVSNYQPSPMMRMMKADAALVSAQKAHKQATIQFDNQVDVVFQLEPVDQQPAKILTAQRYLQPDMFVGLIPLPDIASFFYDFL